MTGRRILEIGGIIAGTLMIAFGVGALVMSINARNTVSNEVTAEQIVGSADMNPTAIKVAMTEAGLKNVAAPTCNDRRSAGRERQRRPLLRPVHAHSRARVIRWADLLADGPVRRSKRSVESGRHERRDSRAQGRRRQARSRTPPATPG